ncbi:Metal-binding domain-containing protein [Desulfofarcimen acetoxidans DSM 771]|uniref:Metal-binding domain-containing protein n=1 Tax=Desulfofarcimen acetoxidans (strain ATCC 49208 / DSM 771 / KCTC 5769 / VKM B-1644 / 5575) TaxID=485916 RepID=C8W439_DESAS|nr:FmdE family protein [Desulfofarcimen acetoxidans]ACV61293.1 Metal-binding domain-containing protein [Desulfofarcimen acetoxidans DSM 771]
MRKTTAVCVLLCMLFVLPGLVLAQGTTADIENLVGKGKVTSLHLLGVKATNIAMQQLSFTKGDANVLAMTDAGYSIISGQTTEKCIDGVIAASGCTTGGSNLLMIHRSKELPLWFAFFKEDTRDFIYLQVNSAVVNKSVDELNKLADNQIFNIIAKENIKLDDLYNNPDKWNEKINNKVFGGNESSLIGIASIWAHPKCTFDFLQAAQFHNHICPGVNSGYLISKYLDKNLPLQQGQSYKIFAVPSWCKDDALQVIYDATVGKKGMFASDLTEEQKKMLPDNAKGVAGIYIRWDAKTNTGSGLVLAFDFDKASELAGVQNAAGPFVKLKTALTMMDYVNQPEIMVSTLKQFNVASAEELTALQAAGVNPLIKLGIMEEVK